MRQFDDSNRPRYSFGSKVRARSVRACMPAAYTPSVQVKRTSVCLRGRTLRAGQVDFGMLSRSGRHAYLLPAPLPLEARLTPSSALRVFSLASGSLVVHRTAPKPTAPEPTRARADRARAVE